MNKMNQSFYRMLFDKSPVSLWIEDFTGIQAELEKMKKRGISDLRTHLKLHPDQLDALVNKLVVVDVNNATLSLYKAKDKQELLNNLQLVFKGEVKEYLLESFIAVDEGKEYFEGQGINYDLEGNKLYFKITWSIPESEQKDYETVIVAMQDMTKLTLTSNELEKREALFRCIFEQSSEGMLLLDNSGTIMMANETMGEHLGIPVNRIIGSYLLDVYEEFGKKVTYETSYELSKEKVLRIISEHQDRPREAQFSFLDSHHKVYARKHTFMPISTKDVTLYAFISTDLTPAYRSERITAILHKISHAVNTTESLDELFHIIHDSLAKIIDATNFYIALYDGKNNMITFPYLVDEMEENASPVVADDSKSLTAQIINEARPLLLDADEIQDRVKIIGAYGVECKNFLGIPLILSGNVIGALVVQSYTKTNLYDEEDQLLLESVSEQIAFALHKKQTDDSIKILIQAIEQAGEGTIIFSPEGNIKYVNSIFEKIIGFRKIDLIDKPFEFLPFESSKRWNMKQSWMRDRSSQPWRGKVDLTRKDGSKATLDMIVKPVIDDEGRLSSIIASCKDVTYEILQEEQMKRSQRLEALGRLTGGIAHDFNNILSAIVGYTELTADDLIPESDAAMNLLEVLKSATRAKEMIKQLISFSRQEESKTEVIDLVDHVRESVRFLKSYMPRSIQIKEDYKTDKSSVLAVPSQIHQIVINLGTNSMQALKRDDALIEISVENVSFRSSDMQAFPELEQSQYLKISVSDNGTGIEPSIIDHIFDPYFTTKGATDGTGLGLSIVHSIIQAHHGAIRVKSEPGFGTTFDVYLPLYISEQRREDSTEEIVEEIDYSGTECIMFVDDEPSLVSVFRQGMMRLGYKVEGFTDPRKAEEFFSKNPDAVDIVVTDTTMPYINGVDLAARLMTIKPDIPIIICTGFTTLISMEEARQRGIRDYIMKPFKIKDIAIRIKDILNSAGSDDAPGSIAE
jgi:PAS domain S-box-containing protein